MSGRCGAGFLADRLRGLRPIIPTVADPGSPLGFGVLSYAAIQGVHPAADADIIGKQTGQQRPSLSLQRTVPALAAAVPQLLTHVGIMPVAQLEEAEVSTRLATATAADTGPDAKAAGARLIGADLRFASAERVYLALSDLRRADLLGADFWSADLRGANLTGANLAGALLFEADVRKVRANAVPVADRVIKAGALESHDTLFCSRTSFGASNLRYARLNSARPCAARRLTVRCFRGATFNHARRRTRRLLGPISMAPTFAGRLDSPPIRSWPRSTPTRCTTPRFSRRSRPGAQTASPTTMRHSLPRRRTDSVCQARMSRTPSAPKPSKDASA